MCWEGWIPGSQLPGATSNLKSLTSGVPGTGHKTAFLTPCQCPASWGSRAHGRPFPPSSVKTRPRFQGGRHLITSSQTACICTATHPSSGSSTHVTYLARAHTSSYSVSGGPASPGQLCPHSPLRRGQTPAILMHSEPLPASPQSPHLSITLSSPTVGHVLAEAASPGTALLSVSSP